MSRSLPDWITSYLEYTDNTESPLQFNTWIAVSCLAGTLQRRVWFQWAETVYPNHMILLVGDSGRTRKGLAIDKARPLFDNSGLQIIGGNSITRRN